MRVLEYRNGAPIAALEAGVGPYRLRQTGDAAWPPKERAYGGEVESLWLKALPLLLAAALLILPVLLLTVLLGASYLYADAVLPDLLPGFARNVTLTISDLVLPATWLAIHLTNRRYGPPHAVAQLGAAMALVLLTALINPYDINNWVAFMPSLAMRAVLAFGFAFITANVAAIAVFDGARGPRWWTAPLAGSFAASLLFSLIYYPAAFAGTGNVWLLSMLAHFALFAGESVLLLVPFWLLRPAMRPLPGLNGY